MKPVNLVDFPKAYKAIKKEIDASVVKVLRSGRYVMGEEGKSFEKKLCKYLSAKYCVGVASGTDALTLSLKALDLKKGDGVILPANVYPSVFGIFHSGVDIQLSDVDKDTCNISVENIKRVIKKNTKAIVLVHLYGNPVDFDPIYKYAKDRNIKIVEDCAQAIGAEYKGKKLGTLGEVSCFSFYPTKNLGAFGDGGAIVTNDKKIYEKVKLWRMYGEKGRYDSTLVGHNSRLDEIQSAILKVKLKHLNKWNNRRRTISKQYIKAFEDLPVKVTKETAGSKSVYHLFTMQIDGRDKFMRFLASHDVGSAVHYPVPVHLTDSFSYLRHKRGSFPISEKLCKNIVSLPLYPEMTKKQVDCVIKVVRKYFKNK